MKSLTIEYLVGNEEKNPGKKRSVSLKKRKKKGGKIDNEY